MIKEKFYKQKFDINFTDEDLEYYNSIRKDYLSDILEKSNQMDKLLNIIYDKKIDKLNVEKIFEANRIAHSIKGTGYSFGFKFISEICFCIEELLDNMYKSSGLPKKDIDMLTLRSADFNNILFDVVENYYLPNKKFDTPDEYKIRFVEVLNKSELSASLSSEPEPQKKTSVLLCDNSDFLIKSIESNLKKFSDKFIFLYSSDISDALWKIEMNKFDIVITSYHFGNFTGLSLFSALKHSISYKKINLYIITSNIDDAVLQCGFPSEKVLRKDVGLVKKLCGIIEGL